MLQLTRLPESQTRLTQIQPYSSCLSGSGCGAHLGSWSCGLICPLPCGLASNSSSEVVRMRPTLNLHAQASPTSTGTTIALSSVLLPKNISYNLLVSRRGHSRVHTFNTQKQEVIIITCAPCYDSCIMNLLLWSTALTCTFKTVSDAQVDTWMLFSFYFSITGVLWGKVETGTESTSGLCLKIDSTVICKTLFMVSALPEQAFDPAATREHISHIQAASAAIKLPSVLPFPHLLINSHCLQMSRATIWTNFLQRWWVDEESHEQV